MTEPAHSRVAHNDPTHYYLCAVGTQKWILGSHSSAGSYCCVLGVRVDGRVLLLWVQEQRLCTEGCRLAVHSTVTVQ